MKLLFDQNVSPALARHLADIFPGSEHVSHVDLDAADDVVLWRYAGTNGFIVVSKDADFSELSMIHGYPPKLVWLRVGNCRTDHVEQLIRSNFEFIVQFAADDERGILSLFAKNAR